MFCQERVFLRDNRVCEIEDINYCVDGREEIMILQKLHDNNVSKSDICSEQCGCWVFFFISVYICHPLSLSLSLCLSVRVREGERREGREETGREKET